MDALPKELLPEFMEGNHVIQHYPGTWNGIWSDMYNETKIMRYGHEAGGLIGITLQPSAVARWALSLHIYSQLYLAAMKGGRQDKIGTHPKEEYNARKQTDAFDRAKIRDTLTAFISPLDTSSHPSCLVNIATGLLASSNVNVDSSVTIGTLQI